MTIICGLDIATRTGWAVGAPGTKPEFGSRRIAEIGAEEGKIFSLFAGWLGEMVTSFRVTDLFVESVYIPTPRKPRFVKAGTEVIQGKGPPPIDPKVLNRLIGLRAIARLIAWRHNVEYHEETAGTITKHFTGFARFSGGRDAKKAATMAMAQHYGFTPENDDEADALAIFFYAESTMAPLGSRSAGPLFVGMKS